MARLKFVKMQGCGNDFVVVDGFAEGLPEGMAEVAMRLCDRHFGIGADGVLALYPAEGHDFEMRIFQPDGSEAEMCGNGIRCAALYALRRGIADRRDLRVKTKAGLIQPLVNEGMTEVRVDMGAPRLAAAEVPCLLGGSVCSVAGSESEIEAAIEAVIEQEFAVAGRKFAVTAVSMGNPHAVIFIDESVESYPVREYGSLIENDAAFPARVNVEFAEVIDGGHIRVRVWERGCGETLACGTGSCATGVAAILTGRAKDEVDIMLPGGTLHVSWRPGESVFMTGAAEVVFAGEVEI